MDYKVLLEISNTIQEALALLGGQEAGALDTELNLPQIAVVGAQSVGKSSVLESIVGFDFLPRGKGMVTRRPLMIEMKNCDNLNGQDMICCLKDRTKSKRFSKASDVRNAIEDATKNHPQCVNNNVCDDPLVLEIISAEIATLTLIDLPGMTKCPTKDQPADICSQIENIVRKYVQHENTIILAVSPANADIATSDAVQIARQVDPNFSRTIGVLTKVDIMDKGTEYEARELIQGRDKNFPKVWIPVKNRCHANIYVDKSTEEKRMEEMDFFDDWFKDLCWEQDKCGVGIEHLCKTLEARFCKCLQEKMPSIETNIERLHKKKVAELEAWKTDHDPSFWKTKALTAMHTYCSDLEKVLDGRSSRMIRGASTISKDPSIGAKIVRLYRSDFLQQVQALDPLEDYRDDEELRILIENTRGHGNGIFLPNEALKCVVQQNVDKLFPICRNLVYAVSQELKQHILVCGMDQINSTFQRWTQEHVNMKIDAWTDDCAKFVDVLVNMEKLISRDHPIHPLRLEDIEHEEDMQTMKLVDGTDLEGSLIPTSNMPVSSAIGGVSISQHAAMTNIKKKKKIKTPFTKTSTKKRVGDDEAVAVAAFGKEDHCLEEIQPFSPGSDRATGSITYTTSDDFVQEQTGYKDDASTTIERTVSDEETVKRGSSIVRDSREMSIVASQRGAFLACHGVRDVSLGGHPFEELQIIRMLLKKYFETVVRAKIIDSVPKAVSYHLVLAVQERLWDEMISEFHKVEKEGDLEQELMGLTDDDRLKVVAAEDAVKKLERAMDQMKQQKVIKVITSEVMKQQKVM